MKGAVWQVESDVFELHVCQPFSKMVGREMLMLASVFLVLDMCASMLISNLCSQAGIDCWAKMPAIAPCHISGVRPCKSRGRRPSGTGAG